MFTGKLSTELIEGGIGYRTELKYQKDGHIDWPFKDDFIFNILYRQGWSVKLYVPCCPLITDDGHEGSFTEHLAHNDKTYKYERITIYEGNRWTESLCRKAILESNAVSKRFYENEARMVKKIQQPAQQNQFWYVQYHHYNMAVKTGSGVEMAIKGFMQILNNWDFNEKGALFWVFSDHGNFHKFDYKCQPNAYNVWALVRDNTHSPLNIQTEYISIMDFYPTLLKKVGIKCPGLQNAVSIEKARDSHRVYFIEDGRLNLDIYKPITFVACKFIDRFSLKAVSYFQPRKEYFCYKQDMKTRTITELKTIDVELKRKLKGKYPWII